MELNGYGLTLVVADNAGSPLLRRRVHKTARGQLGPHSARSVKGRSGRWGLGDVNLHRSVVASRESWGSGASALGVLVPFELNLEAATVRHRIARKTERTYSGSRRDVDGLCDTGASVDVATNVGAVDVFDGAVAGRDTDTNVPALVNTVHEQVLHGNWDWDEISEEQEERQREISQWALARPAAASKATKDFMAGKWELEEILRGDSLSIHPSRTFPFIADCSASAHDSTQSPRCQDTSSSVAIARAE